MRIVGWWWLMACGGDPSEPSPRREAGTDGIVEGPAPCAAEAGLTVEALTVDQPWTEHEAEFTVQVSAPAAVAVACTLEGEPSEVHLVEGPEPDTEHVLRLAGLLRNATYQCRAVAVCPSSSSAPATATLSTPGRSNPDLPWVNLRVDEPGAGRDYIVTNHQRNDGWNGQRRLVIDRDSEIRWHSAPNAGGGAGGSAVDWSPTSRAFTIGGGWPPNNNGRAQQIDLFGSTLRYDVKPQLPDADALQFHHEAREIHDGRLLSLEEPRIEGSGGSFRGFGVNLVDPDADALTFRWSSQRAFDEGHLPGGGGDVYHANWADVVDVGGQDVLFVSLCTQGWTVAIDVPSGDWRWTFGAGGDFALVDRDGTSLPDHEYPQCQHGLQVEEAQDGVVRLLVYDNGTQRGFSRAVAFDLDESTLTATKQWDWTENNWFERSLGGVDWTSAGVLVAMGHIESATPSPGDKTTFVEIDPATGEKLWEIRYTDVHDMAFRAEAIDPCAIFANAKFCEAVAERLEVLADVLGD